MSIAIPSRVLLAAGAVLLLAACGGDELPPTPTPLPTAPAATPVACPVQSPGTTSDDPNATVTLTMAPDGLQSGDITVGTGAAVTNGESLTVQYTGWLSNGQVFDSSRSAGRQPFTFTIGQGNVIKGWDEGLIGMKVGGKRRLVIPAALAYGAQSPPGSCIPANATLTFDVELVNAAAASPSAAPATPAYPSPSPT